MALPVIAIRWSTDQRRAQTRAASKRVRVLLEASNRSRSISAPGFECEFTSRTIASAVVAYLAAQERRVTEGELRTSTVEREGYHLRATLKLAEHDPLDLRKLNAKLAARLYDERAGAVNTHRNGLSVARAFGAWCVAQGWLQANPFAGIKGRVRRKRGKPQLRIEEARTFMACCLDLAPRDDGAVLALAYLLLGATEAAYIDRVRPR